MPSKRPNKRGFTLIEMLTSVAIVGLILVLIGYEFDASLGNLIHTRSNRDMESNARVVMSKVTNRLRTASPWVFNPVTPPGGVDQVIVDPVPTASPAASNVLTFYRVHPGSLANSASVLLTLSGVPNPPYDKVTIQRTTCKTVSPGCLDTSPNYLVETAVDSLTLAQSEMPLVLGKDVTAFSVLAEGNLNAAQVDITLTVQSPSSQRCDPKCSYTAHNSIWVGGDQVANQ